MFYHNPDMICDLCFAGQYGSVVKAEYTFGDMRLCEFHFDEQTECWT